MGEPPGLGDDEVHKVLSGLQIDQLCRVFNMEMDCRVKQEGSMEWMLEYIASKMQLLELYRKYIRCHDIMCKVLEQAESEQDDLWQYCGVAFISVVFPPGFYRCLQVGEYSGQSGAKTYRVLVQLRLAFEVFKSADAEQFCQKGTACYYACRGRRSSPMVRVQVEGEQEGIRVHWFSVTLPARLEVTAVEMALDYTQEYCRIELCSPGSRQVAEEFLPKMAAVLLSTKIAQMQTVNSGDWPCAALRPWPIRTHWDMPVMLWVKLQGDQQLIRQDQWGSQLLPGRKSCSYGNWDYQCHSAWQESGS